MIKSELNLAGDRSARLLVGNKQTGAALVVSLVILLVLTVLGVNSMQSLVLEERMAGNSRQAMVSSQAAEIALRAAESWLATPANFGKPADLLKFSAGNPGLYALKSTAVGANQVLKPVIDLYEDVSWTNANSVEVAAAEGFDPGNAKSKLVGVAPRYIIEYIGRVGPPPLDPNDVAPDTRDYAFRITGIGFGEDVNARSLVQSTYFITL